MDLLLPFDTDNDRIEAHEEMMVDVATLIEEYRTYLHDKFAGSDPDFLDALVLSYSNALWDAVLSAGIKILAVEKQS